MALCVLRQFTQPRFYSFSCRTVKSIRSYCSAPGRLYSDKHEWVLVKDDVGTVGISKYAQETLGDVVFAQLPDPGTDVCQHDEVGAVESVKAASELYSPVSGQVTEKNTEVESSPGLINKDCYNKGWLFRIKLTKPDELKELMDEAAYMNFLKSEEH